MRSWNTLVVATATLAVGLAGCTVEAEGEDPADTEVVEEDPGDLDGDTADAEGARPPTEAPADDDVDDRDPPGRDDGDDAEAADELDVDAGEHASLATAETELGEHLADGAGWTLYVSVQDGDGESSCTGDCLARWPIVSLDEEAGVGEGVDGELIGSTTRADGTHQLTYANYPLHRHTDDDAPGDVSGHGVDDEWSVMTPAGQPLLEHATG